MGVEAYIKPVNYEISKTRKYQRNRYKTENMPYDEETDSFICPNGIQPLELLIEKASLVSPQKSPYTDVLNAGTVP